MHARARRPPWTIASRGAPINRPAMPSTLARLLDDDATAFRTHCRYSDRVGQPQAQCVASLRQGAVTPWARRMAAGRFREAFGSGSSFGWTGSSDECDALPRRWTVHNAWKHAGVARRVQSQQCTHRQTLSTCMSFRFGRAKAAKQERQVHAGPALQGCRLRPWSRSERRASGALRADEYGDELYEAEARRPVDAVHECRLCFVRAARLATWARRQAALLYCGIVAARSADAQNAGRAPAATNLFWDECYIVRSEYCMLDSYCANGHEIWNMTPGNWTCVPRRRQQLAARAVKRLR